MSIVAHPDDQEFSVAGTLAKWAKAGCEITSVLITSGDSGSNDPSKGADYKSELARLRETEQLSANEIIGVKQTVFLRYPDGELEPSIALRKDLTKLIRQYKPEVVFAGNPEAWFYGNEYINHPDHRAAARAAAEAVFPSAGSRLIFADLLNEGFEPHEVRKLYVQGTDKPDTWIDIGDTVEIKMQALKKHLSQKDTHGIEEWFYDWAKEAGKDHGIEYAEAFRVMILKEDEKQA